MNEQEMVKILEAVGVEKVLTLAIRLRLQWNYTPQAALDKALSMIKESVEAKNAQ
jgi:hypothetical protein